MFRLFGDPLGFFGGILGDPMTSEQRRETTMMEDYPNRDGWINWDGCSHWSKKKGDCLSIDR